MSRYKLPRKRTSPSPPSQAAPGGVDARVQALTAEAIEMAGRGDLAAAEVRFREAARLQPNLPWIHGNLGNIRQMLGDLDGAAEHYRKALELEPGDVETCNNLGVLLHKLGRSAEAVESLRRAVRGRPGYHEALTNLGNVLQDMGTLEEARECYEKALRLAPSSVAALQGMGNVLRRQKKHGEEALVHYEKAAALAPRKAELGRALATTLIGMDRWKEGLDRLRPALEGVPVETRCVLLEALDALVGERFEAARDLFEKALTPIPETLDGAGREDVFETLGVVCRALKSAGRHAERERLLRLCLTLKPDDALTHAELGATLHLLDRDDEAILQHVTALKLDPLQAAAWSNLSHAYLERGRLDEAEAALERALELDGDNCTTHSNYIFARDLDIRVTQQEAYAERLRWRDRHTGTRPPYREHPNRADEERRLRVGYVSGDFRAHSAACCLLGVLLHHDPEQVEMVCYSTFEGTPDSWTEQFRAAAALWRDVAPLSEQGLCDRIRADAIDILVDLSGHSARNRLLVFARKPAPVQVTAWGYATGTGLDTMDYLITDEVCCPPETQGFYSEKFWYLPCALTYVPVAEAGPVAPLPASVSGVVTFGSLNRLAKVSAESMRAWARILQATPGSRLLLKSRALSSPETHQAVVRDLAALGIPTHRLLLRGGSTPAEHLAAFDEIDIALDPFPHGGGITTLEGLWKGVPAVTLLGGRGPETRITSSMMTVLGLGDFVARTEEEYVEVARQRALEVSRLAEIRQGLRQRMVDSPLVGGRRYCAEVEAAYREMWRTWCRRQTTG